MSVATAEFYDVQYSLDSEYDDRHAFAVPNLGEDQLVRHRAARFIGKVAAEAWNQDRSTESMVNSPIDSLYEAIGLAAKGDETAYKMVEVNVSTDVIERTIKTGHVMGIDMMVDEAGTILQYGQTAESIQANSLRFASDVPQMRDRVEAETRNAFRIKHFYDQGTLNDYNFVVFSRAADDMTQKEMKDAGFFVDTMSCAIQVTSAVDDRLRMESAFVAGTAEPGGQRHDQVTIQSLLKKLGINGDDMTATQLLDTPLLIHKSLMPDGVINLVESYDDAAGGTFFGESKPQQDYRAYRQKCVGREAGFKPTVDAIVTELISQAPYIVSQSQACEKLHKVSEKHMVRVAVADASINPLVFGMVAAEHIEQARMYHLMGNIELADREVSRAQLTAASYSCPGGRKDRNDRTNNERANNSSDRSDENEDGDCEFTSKECPMCHEKNVKTTIKRVRGVRIIQGEGTKCRCKKVVKA